MMPVFYVTIVVEVSVFSRGSVTLDPEDTQIKQSIKPNPIHLYVRIFFVT